MATFRHLLLTCLVFILIACSQNNATEQVISDLSQAEVLNIVESQDDSYVLLDVRSEQEYASGHIKGSVNIPHSTVLANQKILDKYQGKKLVVYCQTGGRARSVTSELSDKQFTDIYHLEGDMLSWNANELPVDNK